MAAQRVRLIWAVLISGLLLLPLPIASWGANEIATPWLEGYKARTRLLAGRVETADKSRLLAFVEIELPSGWKTYWRNPGNAGGLPPAFNWSNSTNLASATVRYPAPQRMTDKSGITIGYMSHVIFPVEIAAKDANLPVKLGLTVQFGICKEICVPVDATLALEIPLDAKGDVPEPALAALERVPRTVAERRPADPAIVHIQSQLEGPNPRLVLDAKFAGDGASADIFLEAPEGLYIPVPAKTSDKGQGNLTFEVNLGADTDIAALKGKAVSATLVDAGGASVANFKVE